MVNISLFLYFFFKIIICLFRIVFSLINSVYCLYWDLFVDWGLCKTISLKSGNSYLIHQKPPLTLPLAKTIIPNNYFFLRPILYFRQPAYYYFAMVVNICLRFSWMIKIQVFYQLVEIATGTGEATIGFGVYLVGIDFLIKIMEVCRRWVWVFFRIEREIVTCCYGI